MLDIFDALEPFFLDNYREYGVREYARETDVSAPTASKRLTGYAAEGLLVFRKERGVHLYHASREPLFVDLQRAYFRQLLADTIARLDEELIPERIVLFGSAANGEFSGHSDIDVFVDAPERSVPIERLHGHEIQLHFRSALKDPGVAAAIERCVQLL